MKSQVFELKPETIRKLCLFVLRKILNQPSDWIGIGKEYQDLSAFEGNELFTQVFVRLFTLMREEGWIASSSDEQLFLVGLTFKGQTVIRHPSEIDAFYSRHFRSWEAKVQSWRAKVAKDARKEKHLAQKEAAQERKAQKGLAKRQATEASNEKRLVRLKAERERTARKAQTSLVASGKRIRASLPQCDNGQLLNLWKANTSRAASSRGPKKNEHLLVVSAVEKEWRRRVRDLPETEAFKWPSTQVGSGVGGGDFERANESFLKVLGYTVGKTNGLPESTRRLILDRCFSGQLPPIESLSTLRLWGEPKTALRLRKIAYHIAGLAKNFKKMPSGGYETAISDWEDDLKYLFDNYYVRHFGFNWPSRTI